MSEKPSTVATLEAALVQIVKPHRSCSAAQITRKSRAEG
jgi:hypothetical protein